MEASTPYSVSLARAAPRTIAAVSGRMPAGRAPTEFRRYLDQVYAARASGLPLDGQNIFVYRDAPGEPGQLDIDFGVGLAGPFVQVGDVRRVELPVGDVAMTTHLGSYAGLGAAHEAVLAWCRGRGLTPAGPRWEVYGHWSDTEPPRTDIYYLLRSASAK